MEPKNLTVPAANVFFENKVIELIRTNGLRRICDYGCGDGAGLQRLARILPPNIRFTGIDRFSEFAEKDRPCNGNRIRFIDRRSEQFAGLSRKAFDLVICSFALHHFEHPVQELKRIANLIAPEGYLFLWDLRFACETDGEILQSIISFLSELRTALAGGYHRHHYTLNQALDLFSALDMKVVSSGKESIGIPEDEKKEDLDQLIDIFKNALDATRKQTQNELKKEHFSAAFEFVLKNLPKYGIGDTSALFVLARKK